ncbi:MAG: glycoside hydrolase family 2 TIM barrel-domain containing protein [Candidatus Omnitrophota bacterium]|nr:glycoside hydrolase family 2 TIM barrel-domain containing protein [Candidatus Omnitrophota bacterium]
MLDQKKFDYLATIFIIPFLLSLAVDIGAETQPPTFELKQIDGIYVPFQNGIPYSSAERQERDYLDLNGTWKSQRQSVDHKLTLANRTPEIIKLIEEEAAGRHKIEYNDTGWKDKTIPGVENPAPDRYQDGVWYRRRFSVPVGAEGKYIRLVFEAANYFTDVWINGKWIGCHEGGYTPFAFDISGYVDYGKDNVIAVRVDNIPWLPDGDRSPEALKTNDHNIVPYRTCDWWNYGGITRDVYAEVSPAVSVVRADIRSKVLDYVNAELDVNVIVYNHSQSEIATTVALSVFPANIRDNNITEPVIKKIANLRKPFPLEGETSKEITLKPKEAKPLKFTFKLNNFKYWSPEEPVLYVLGVKLGDGKVVSDEFYTQFGIREVRVDNANAKLLINGKEVFLRGIARHEVFYGESGVDEYGPPRTSADFRLIKEMNANFIRTAHYPNQHETYLLADRFGFLVWEEIPAYWFEGPEFDIQTKSRGIAKQMWLEMIYRDYNRPSVIIWGTCNECSWQKERADYIRQLREEAYKVDGTRPVAQSAVFSDPTDATQKECDLLGFTTYYGVFYGSSYSSDTKQALEKAHTAFPDKPIVSTEYGIWAPYGDSSQEGIQVELARETFSVFKQAPYVCGATWWAAFDWHTMINEPQTMGAVTMDRKSVKPVYAQLQRQYAALLGDLDVALLEPGEGEALDGKIKITAQTKGKDKIETIDLLIDGQSRGHLSSGKGGLYSAQLNTAEILDGKHTISVRVKSRKGFYVSDFTRVNIDNIDEPPVLTVSLKDNDAVMDKVILTVTATDDRGQLNVTYSVDDAEPQPMRYLGDGVFQAIWDVSGLEDGSIHEVAFKATDPANQTTEKKITVVVDNKPGRYIELPYNHDWISWNKNYSNGTGWDFPAEELPASSSAFIYNGDGRIKFKFGDKLDGALNNLESGKQGLDFAPGYYTKIHILATMHNGGGKASFILHYADGTDEKKKVSFSDWWGANPVYGEKAVIATTHHHEASGDREPGSGIYLQTIEPDKDKILSSITLPSERRLHIFAMTLEGEILKGGE